MARYKYRRVNGVLHTEHELVWLEATGEPVPPGHVIHHKNGNSKDNSLLNLQLMTIGDHNRLHRLLRSQGKDPVDSNDPDVRRHRELQRLGYAINCEERKRRQREYTKNHLEQVRETSRRYTAEHHDEIRAKSRKRYAENPDVYTKKTHEYRHSRIELIRARDRLRRAIKKGYPEKEIELRRQDVEKETKLFKERQTSACPVTA